jgi:hypothetical protein
MAGTNAEHGFTLMFFRLRMTGTRRVPSLFTRNRNARQHAGLFAFGKGMPLHSCLRPFVEFSRDGVYVWARRTGPALAALAVITTTSGTRKRGRASGLQQHRTRRAFVTTLEEIITLAQRKPYARVFPLLTNVRRPRGLKTLYRRYHLGGFKQIVSTFDNYG